MRRGRRTAKSTTTAQDPITKLLNPPSKAEIARGIEERNAELLIEEVSVIYSRNSDARFHVRGRARAQCVVAVFLICVGSPPDRPGDD
jgi:hypothetical protein